MLFRAFPKADEGEMSRRTATLSCDCTIGQDVERADVARACVIDVKDALVRRKCQPIWEDKIFG
jgi:hypothetical protein